MAVTFTQTGINPYTGACSVDATRGDATTYTRKAALDEQPLWKAITIAADGDTYSTGIPNITRMAVAGVYATPYFASAADQLVGKITFKAPAGGAGSLVIWRS